MSGFQAILSQCRTSSAELHGPSWTVANQTTQNNAAFDELYFLQFRRNGNAAAARMLRTCGVAPNFHGLVDPTLGHDPLQTVIYEELISVTRALGDCDAQFGFFQHIVVTDRTSLVGVGFRGGIDTGDEWHAYVADCPTGAGAVTVRHDFDTGLAMATARRLSIVIDGPTRTINWYANRTLVSSFTPATPLDRMSAAADALGPQVHIGAVVPALGDITVRCHAGSFPQLRLGLWAVDGDSEPTTGGSKMYVSVGG
jgi:hypothetical protein